VANARSETRQLTELVAVRLAPDDLNALRQEASRREISVPQLLRDVALGSLRTAS
jgi:predicted DNA binding CopG/RHH family protein